jgi:hypothetical protein
MVGLFQKAVEDDPAYAQAYGNLGLVAASEGKRPETEQQSPVAIEHKGMGCAAKPSQMQRDEWYGHRSNLRGLAVLSAFAGSHPIPFLAGSLCQRTHVDRRRPMSKSMGNWTFTRRVV